MLTRILTALIGLVVFFGVIFAPPFVLYIALLIVTAEMLTEVYCVMDIKGGIRAVGYLAGLVMFIGFFVGKVGIAFYGAILLFMAALVVLRGQSGSKETMGAGMVTIFVTSAILSIAVIHERFRMYAVLLPFIIAWLTDTGAYFTGYFFGKHKLVPKMSPKKTVEGAVGGVVFAIIATAVFGIIIYGNYSAGFILKLALIGGVGSVISQVGDLAASCIKRDYDKKDYGSILPGHGGLMDRFDSVLFAAPYALLVLSYFGIC